MKTSEQILFMLKRQGDLSARQLAEQLTLTTMGVRQHLHSLEQSAEVDFYDKKVKVGRPTRFWRLTAKGDARFPDSHGELSSQLLGAARQVFGEQGLDRLIAERQHHSLNRYQQAIAQDQAETIAQRLSVFSEQRSSEGYMAHWEQTEEGYWFYEDHCPICSAASQCEALCDSELAVLRLLFADCQIIRTQHIVQGERQCAYRLRPKV